MTTVKASRLGARTRARTTAFGTLLKWWRDARHKSQLALAIEAGISPRHLSFLETGRAQPSREMIHKLAGVLDVPLRERNALLLGAGFAPSFHESAIDLEGDDLAPIRAALDAMLGQHEPFPAVVLNRRWDVLKTNAAADRFFGFLLEPRSIQGPVNVLRMMLGPNGVRETVRNWDAVAETLIRRVHREAVGGVIDEATQALLDEVLAYPGVEERWRAPNESPTLPVIPVVFEKRGRTFRYFSAVTTLGTPQDILLQEIRVESFFPVDDETRRHARELASTDA